jgi:hypothetical protein
VDRQGALRIQDPRLHDDQSSAILPYLIFERCRPLVAFHAQLVAAKVEESIVGDATIALKRADFDKHRQGGICIFPSPLIGEIRLNNITRRVVASPIRDLQRDLGESK